MPCKAHVVLCVPSYQDAVPLLLLALYDDLMLPVPDALEHLMSPQQLSSVAMRSVKAPTSVTSLCSVSLVDVCSNHSADKPKRLDGSYS